MIQLGATVKDKITGLTGVVMGRTEYLTGCAHVGTLQRTLSEKGEVKDWQWIDESRVDVVPEEPIIELNQDAPVSADNTGGPQPAAPEC